MQVFDSKPDTAPGLFDLTGKTALVTGGAGNIGSAVAMGLAMHGANIVLCGRTQSSLNWVADTIEEYGTKVLAITADCRSEKECRRIVAETVAQFGQLDILVAAAGMSRRFPAGEFPEDVLTDILDVNAKGVFFMNKAAGNQMIRQCGGKIINIASIRAFIGHQLGYSAFAASKGAVVALTRQLAVEWASSDINVNCIASTELLTKETECIYTNQEAGSIFIDRIPFKRTATPQDLIGTAVYLASSASDFVTGQTICVDGGYTAS